MTREEAKTEILQFSNKFNDLDWDTQDELIALVDGRIDEIYDDFESRTCTNCKYFTKIGACQCEDSLLFDKLSVDEFGCNKWESEK